MMEVLLRIQTYASSQKKNKKKKPALDQMKTGIK